MELIQHNKPILTNETKAPGGIGAMCLIEKLTIAIPVPKLLLKHSSC